MSNEIQALLAAYAAKQEELQEFGAFCEAQQAELWRSIPSEVREALDRVETSRKNGIATLVGEIDTLATKIKQHVLALHGSIKHAGYQAVYTPGRVAWDDTWLQGYAATHAELLLARKEGQPSVSIRKAK